MRCVRARGAIEVERLMKIGRVSVGRTRRAQSAAEGLPSARGIDATGR